MTYLDYYEKGPEVLLAVLLFSLVVTIFAYGLLPFIYARTRTKTITEKKFKRICYGFNAIPMIFFFLLNGKTTLMPYLLWTSVFVYFGKNKLERRGILVDADTKESAGIESTVPTHSDGETQIRDQILEEPADYVGKYQQPNYSETTKVKPNSKQRYCKLCGGAIDIDTKKCSKCGKQYFHIRIHIGRVFTVIVIFLSLSIAAVSIYQNIQYRQQISQYQQRIEDLTDQISELSIQHTPDSDSTVPNQMEIKMPTVSRPANRQIFRYSVSTSKPHAPLEITTPPGGTDYFFIVEHLWDTTKNAKFYMYSGTTMEINIAPGEYEIYYASGTEWYGTKYLFGEGTQYHKFSDIFEFSDGYGWTVEMKKTSNGNLDSEMVDVADFPQ